MSALAGVCAALLPPEAGGPDTDVLASRVGAFATRLPPEARYGLRAGMVALDGLAVATTGRRLATLDEDGRARVLDRLASTSVGSQALDALKALVLLVAGAHEHAGDMLARSSRDDPARPSPALDVTPASSWPSTAHVDAVVVGSGAGGAIAARTLAGHGLDVVVVEEGRRWDVEEFRTAHPLDRFAGLYRDAGTTIVLGRPPVVMPIGRGVGGSTLVNSGTCFRTPAGVLQRWRDVFGVDLDGAHLDDVERTLHVAPVPPDVMGNNGRLLLDGAHALGWRAGPLLRNAPGCGGCCQCAIGCPRNAKLGVHLSVLPHACAAGARIVSEARVDCVIHERGRAAGVRCRRASDGTVFEVRAPIVVVAAGATETPPLLRRSGLGGHPWVGRNLSLHPAVPAAGRFESPVVAWHGVLQSAAVEEFHERDGILVEATSTPPGMGSMVLPGHGRRLVEQIAAADHLVTLGAMVADAGSGHVRGRRKSVLTYLLSRGDGARLRQSVGVMGRLLFAAGAVEVLTGVPSRPVVRSVTELDDALASTPPHALHVAAFHPTGTARMGRDPSLAPVDVRGRLRGVDGVWVADASLLPSSPTVNPQVSIMAMAAAVAGEVVTS
jgi:choline dehydrogenase-like flavoprotein